jgi:hypothetical protein
LVAVLSSKYVLYQHCDKMNTMMVDRLQQ